jgi:hypothetical protein
MRSIDQDENPNTLGRQIKTLDEESRTPHSKKSKADLPLLTSQF